MTTEELELERRYRITERLGILCADGKPTEDQIKLAEKEADLAIEQLRKEDL